MRSRVSARPKHIRVKLPSSPRSKGCPRAYKRPGLLANISPTTTASLFYQLNQHSSPLTSSSSQPLSKMSSPTPSILVDNPKAENESWETWGERLAEKYKTPSATPGLPLVPGSDKLRTYLTISSSYLIDSNSAFIHSRNLVRVRNPVEGILQHQGRWQAHFDQRPYPPSPPHHRGYR